MHLCFYRYIKNWFYIEESGEIPMKNKVLISITIIALFSATFCMFMPAIGAQGYALYNLESKRIYEGMTLDGHYDAEEYNEVDTVSFRLYEHNNPTTNQRVIEVASVYNDTTLFLWISVDETEYEFPTLFLVFQSTSEPIIIDHTVPTWSVGNDVKMIEATNTSSDRIMSSSAEPDENYGGTNDFEGKCFTRSGGYNFELAITLNSGDTEGGDLSLMPGSSINMFPLYVNNGGNNNYALIHTVDNWWEQILVKLVEPSIPSYSIPILIFSVLAVSMFLIFKHYSKK
jgi:hypothetical protein